MAWPDDVSSNTNSSTPNAAPAAPVPGVEATAPSTTGLGAMVQPATPESQSSAGIPTGSPVLAATPSPTTVTTTTVTEETTAQPGVTRTEQVEVTSTPIAPSDAVGPKGLEDFEVKTEQVNTAPTIGGAVMQKTEPETQPVVEKKRGQGKIVVAAIALLLIAGGGGGGAWFLTQQAQQEQETRSRASGDLPTALITAPAAVVESGVLAVNGVFESLPTGQGAEVSGAVCAYGEAQLPGKVLYYNLDSKVVYSKSIIDGEIAYIINVPAGKYLALFKPTDTEFPPFAYTEFVKCGMTGECLDHGMVATVYETGKQYGQAHTCDPQYPNKEAFKLITE